MSSTLRTKPTVRRERVVVWAARALSIAAIVVIAWVSITAFPMLVHGEPTYLILILVTFSGAAVVLVVSWRAPSTIPRRAQGARIGLLALGAGLVVLIGWLAPSVAVDPALSGMTSTHRVTVKETSSEIVLRPTRTHNTVGLFFQPGAKVDARAYVAELLPVALAGHVVVIAKQPLGIAFLALDAFSGVRHQFPSVHKWVVGGHSLGGTVAAITANSFCGKGSDPVVGLVLLASYPASDLRRSLNCPVLSISGSNDGLATPNQISTTKRLLPSSTRYVQIHGAVHAYFGDYGTQSGDGQPSISHSSARRRISELLVQFLDSPAT